MNIPQNLSLEILETKHPEYQRTVNSLKEIDLITSGGNKIREKVEYFLPRRRGEDAKTYELRLNKFTYLNLLGSAINDQVSKISNSSLIVSGLDNAKFWNEFRDNIDLKGKSEKHFLSNVLREILKFKKVYIHIDKPNGGTNVVNKAQEEILNIRPYTVMYSAFQVINWEESRNGFKWIKIKQIQDIAPSPFEKAKKYCIWTIIDSKNILRYGAEVEVNAANEIIKVEGKNTDKDTKIKLIQEPIIHGYNEVPVVKVELPDEVWVADQAASKAIEHLRIDCSKYDLLTMAYFQRTYKTIQQPDSDLENSYIDVNNTPPPSGLQHLLELEKFEWNEPHGYVLPHLMESLRQIEGQIRDLVSQGGFSATEGNVRQSGISKEMDYYKEEAILKMYGEILIESYQNILNIAAKSMNSNPKDISVTGFNDFNNNSLESDIEKLSLLAKIDFVNLKENMPKEAYKIIFSNIINKAVGSVSPKQLEEIMEEI